MDERHPDGKQRPAPEVSDQLPEESPAPAGGDRGQRPERKSDPDKDRTDPDTGGPEGGKATGHPQNAG